MGFDLQKKNGFSRDSCLLRFSHLRAEARQYSQVAHEVVQKESHVILRERSDRRICQFDQILRPDKWRLENVSYIGG